MRTITILAAALALGAAATHPASAHEQQAVIDGQRVQPTPDMIRKLKREHATENERKTDRRNAGPHTQSHPRVNREKGRSGVEKDEGLPKQDR